MWLAVVTRRVLELRTNGENINRPAEWFYAEHKAITRFFSNTDVRVIIANVDPITNIYDGSSCPPR